MSLRPIGLPLTCLMMTALSACNLSATFGGTPPAASPGPTEPALVPTTAVPTAALVTPTPSPEPPTLTPEPPTPTPRPPSPTPTMVPWSLNVSSIGRLSLTEGWVLTGGQLLWSEDAGASWSDITPAGLSNCPAPDRCWILGRAAFLDANRIRIAVLRAYGQIPLTTLSFMYTEDGGRTWGLSAIDEFGEYHMCPGYACVSEVDLEFVDPRNGWLAAKAPLGMGPSAPYLYRTRDAGRSWTELEMPIVGQVTFIDAWTGWALGGEGRGLNGWLYYTRDGGSTWREAGLDIPDGPAVHGYDYQAPLFFTHNSGVIPVHFHGREDRDQMLGFYTTGNAGETWVLAARLEDPDLKSFGFGSSVPWSAFDESTWFVAVSEAKQYLTRDRGQSWEVIAGSGLNGFELTEVQFVSEAEGWGLGRICYSDFGCMRLLHVTHDGGRSWQMIEPGLAP